MCIYKETFQLCAVANIVSSICKVIAHHVAGNLNADINVNVALDFLLVQHVRIITRPRYQRTMHVTRRKMVREKCS